MGAERCATIKLAVMDMWKPFRNVTQRNAPQARIVYDKFHILGHLADAMDAVRRIEYKRVNDKERTYIKGQRYTLLSNRANLDLDGRRALRLLLKANKRLNKAYLLKESFGQMWNYNSPVWCRKFFDNWQAQLRWSRLEPFKKFAAMVERHWDGIVSYCHPDNKVSLGFMEGRAPRKTNTGKEVLGRSVNCMQDEGSPLGAGRQRQASNHLELRRLRAGVVSVKEKV